MKEISIYKNKIRKNLSRIPRLWLEGGSKKRASLVKSWKDAGDTLCRHNH
jgi:hypothetical protein